MKTILQGVLQTPLTLEPCPVHLGWAYRYRLIRAALKRRSADRSNSVFQSIKKMLWVLVWLFLILVVAAIVSFLLNRRISSSSSWSGKHVVVTGGSDGLGLHFACAAAQRGAHVTLLARGAAKLALAKQAVAAKVLSAEQRVNTLAADVSDVRQMKQVLGALNRVDVLVANAGIAVPRLCEDQTDEEIRQMMDVNFFGAANAARAVLPAMQKAGQGHIVFVASAMSLTAFAGYAGYCASKWALRGFAECLQSELAPSGVTVQIFYAPTMKTPGLVAENLAKPAVTHELESFGDALEPADAAQVLLNGIGSSRFDIAGDLGAELLSMAALGSPYGNTALRWLMAPVLVPVAGLWRWYTRRVAFKHLAGKERK